MTRSRWAATAMLALAFALGGLAGGAATMLADKDHPAPLPRRPNHAAYQAQMRQEYLDRLRQEVSITPSQEQQVNEVLDRYQPAFDSLWRSIDGQFGAIRRDVRKDVRALLDASQQGKYDLFVAKRDSIRRAEHEGAGRDEHK